MNFTLNLSDKTLHSASRDELVNYAKVLKGMYVAKWQILCEERTNLLSELSDILPGVTLTYVHKIPKFRGVKISDTMSKADLVSVNILLKERISALEGHEATKMNAQLSDLKVQIAFIKGAKRGLTNENEEV